MLPKAFLASRLAALLAAVLIGMAESTGMAPPPLIMFDGEIEWISLDRDEETGLPFELLLDPVEKNDADSDAGKRDPGRSRSHVSRLLDGLRHRF